MTNLILKLYNALPERGRNVISRIQYEYLSVMDKKAAMLFMNYGWAPLDGDSVTIVLNEEDERDRFCIQLYHHVCKGIDFSGKKVLEVGCGRGGGASYMMRYFHPETLTGVDRASLSVKFCSKYYNVPGLSFVRGNAEELRLPGNSFDIVVNIESAHCYLETERFFSGVARILKPGGYFCMADFWLKEKLERIRLSIEKQGLKLLKEENITPNVVKALELDNERKRELIKEHVPRILRGLFVEFAGMKGTDSAYAKLKNGEMEYARFVMRK